MTTLTLGDLKDMDHKTLVQHIVDTYLCGPSDVKRFNILIAYEDSCGYEGSSWFLLRDRASKALFEVHGSHCSCYGFEDQWTPEPSTLKYLKSEHFHFYNHGGNETRTVILAAIKRLRT